MDFTLSNFAGARSIALLRQSSTTDASLRVSWNLVNS